MDSKIMSDDSTMKTEKKKKVLACPKCGGKEFSRIIDDEDGLAWAVICQQCGESMTYIEVEEIFAAMDDSSAEEI